MKSKMKNLRPLPQKRRIAVALFLTPPYMSMAAALRVAGYSEATARHHAHRIFHDPRVQQLLKLHHNQTTRRFLEAIGQAQVHHGEGDT
jgi:hypothetical protein